MGRKRWLGAGSATPITKPPEGTRPEHPGPIATALKAADRFDRVVLLTNYPATQQQILQVAGGNCAVSRVFGGAVGRALDSPIDYAEIYRCVSEQLIGLSLPSDDVDVTFHLYLQVRTSSGSPSGLWGQLLEPVTEHWVPELDRPFLQPERL